MHAILNAEPLEFEGDAAKLPPAISTIVRRCLEKRPEQRFQSAADLAFALKSISTTESVSAHGMPAAPPIARKRDWLWLAAATAAMALIGAGYALSLLISKPSNPQYQRVTFRKGDVSGARFTPLAVLRKVNGTSRIEYPLGTVLIDRIGGPLDSIRVSPDGQKVAFLSFIQGRRVELNIVDRSGQRHSLGPISAQTSSNEPSSLAWSPNGDEIWFRSLDPSDAQTIYAINLKASNGLLPTFLAAFVSSILPGTAASCSVSAPCSSASSAPVLAIPLSAIYLASTSPSSWASPMMDRPSRPAFSAIAPVPRAASMSVRPMVRLRNVTRWYCWFDGLEISRLRA